MLAINSCVETLSDIILCHYWKCFGLQVPTVTLVPRKFSGGSKTLILSPISGPVLIRTQDTEVHYKIETGLHLAKVIH